MSVCLCFCVIVFLHLCFSFLATQHCSKAHPVHLGYRSLRQPGASNRISSRFIAAIGNLKSLVTSVNAENWSGLVTLRSSGLTVQDLQPAVQTCVPLKLSAASHHCNLRVRNCLTLPHTNTLEYTLHTCSGVQVRNNSPRRVLGTQQHCESCPASLRVSSSGAHHWCPWVPIAHRCPSWVPMGAHGCPRLTRTQHPSPLLQVSTHIASASRPTPSGI